MPERHTFCRHAGGALHQLRQLKCFARFGTDDDESMVGEEDRGTVTGFGTGTVTIDTATTYAHSLGEPVEIDGRTLVLVDQIGGPLDRATFGLATRREGRIEDRWPRAEDMTPAWSDAMAPVAGPDGGAGSG